MSRTGDWIIELMERGEWQEDPHQYDYSPHDYATGQPEWHDTLGRCLEFCFQVMEKQSEIQGSAFNLFHAAEYFAVQVIAHKAPCDLETAYISMGYPQEKTHINNVDPIPF